MKQWIIHLEAKSDLLIPSLPTGGNESESVSFIPGSALRGAFAAGRAPGHGSQPDDGFAAAFLSPHVVFCDAVPVPVGSGAAFRPVPLSAMTCKRRPGFPADEGHGVYGRFRGPCPPECPECRAPMERFAGWYSRSDGQLRSFSPSFAQQAHVGLDDHTGQAAEGALFTEFRIPRETKLEGAIRLLSDEEHEIESLEQYLGLRAGADDTLYVGRGGGRVKAWFSTSNQDPTSGLSELRDGQLVELVLESPAIVQDDFGRCLRSLDVNALAAMLHIQPAALGLRCVKHYAFTHWVWGWNGAHDLPKPRDLALARGSCGVFEVTDAKSAKSNLESLLTRGGGFRTNEGFGQVAVADPEIWTTTGVGDGG